MLDQNSPSENLLGFDFGEKRIGVALGSLILRQARPLSIIAFEDNIRRFITIEALIKEWDPDFCVIGLPMHPDGTEHEMSRRSRRFANQITGRFQMKVVLVDERYSSAVLPNRHGIPIDNKAAAVILQQYFDSLPNPYLHTFN